ALLDFTRAVLRDRFSSMLQRPVFTFEFDRYSNITAELRMKLEYAKSSRAVLVTTPTAIKSFMLKFVELMHNLDEQKNLSREKQEKVRADRSTMLGGLRGMLRKRKSTAVLLSAEALQEVRI